MTSEVDLERFASAQTAGAMVLDVREPGEYVEGHVPGARLVPLSQVLARLAEVPREGPVYVICASGNRSATAVDWLRSAGIDAISVAGGTSGWIQQGRPVASGLDAGAALPADHRPSC